MLSINVNTTALATMRHLNMSSSALKTSIERLSTGFKINRAADNASNLSISKKMGTQLSGTKVAQENAQQAIALLDTADGALDEMTSIANRIRDLSLQAMNGTYSEKERQIMQKEVNKLTLELYRQRNSTKYNKMNIFGESETPLPEPLLGGGATSNSGIATVSAVNAVSAAEKPYKAELEYLESTGTQWIPTGIISNGSNLKYEVEIAFTKTNGTRQLMGGDYAKYWGIDRNGYYITSGQTGVKASMDGTFDKIVFSTQQGKISMQINGGDIYTASDNTGTHEIYLFTLSTNTAGFSSSARLGNYKIYENDTLVRDYIAVLDNNNVACMYDKVTGQFFYNQGTGDFIAGPVVPEPEPPASEPEPMPVALDSVDFQIGANSGENNMLNVDLGFSLGGFAGDVTSIESASDTLNAVDELKKTLNEKRSEIGVSRNRIDGIIESQSIKIENLSASHSTIVDTDFARETAKLTRNQILQQATTSLLSQANFMPNIALQLLS